MWKFYLRVAIPIAAYTAIFFLLPQWRTWAVLLIGVWAVISKWRSRNVPPMDPLLMADIREFAKVEKSDKAAAEKLLDRALTDATERENRQLEIWRANAAVDPRAAFQLRNQLRYNLESQRTGRQLVDKWEISAENRVAVLKESDRTIGETEHRLAEAEQLLAQGGGYGWQDQLRHYWRASETLPSGGLSAWFTFLWATIAMVAAVALVKPFMRPYIALFGAGVLVAVFGLLRPQAFWESETVEDLRATLGDRTLVLLCVIIGVLIFVVPMWFRSRG